MKHSLSPARQFKKKRSSVLSRIRLSFYFKATTHLLIAGILLSGFPSSDAQESFSIKRSEEGFMLEWDTEDQTTYFLEKSSNLTNWSFVNNYEIGDGEDKQHPVPMDSGSSFYRLLKAPTNPLNPHDTDGDGASNSDELTNGSNALVFEDSDGDGISDHQELLIIDHDPDDSIVDFTDVTAYTDYDSDGLNDIDEFKYGLKFYDRFDSVKDLDGDRIPTLHEVWKGTDPLNGDSSIEGNVPDYDYIVDQNDTVLDPDDNIYVTIQEAVDDVASYTQAIIYVKPGDYAAVNITGIRYDRDYLFLADTSDDVTVSGFSTGRYGLNRYFRNTVSIDGFIIKGATTGYGTSGTIATEPSIISNCIFDDLELAVDGGRAPLILSHCTFRNRASSNSISGYLDFRAQTSGGVIDYYKISNCSVWGTETPDKYFYTDEIINDYTSGGAGIDKSHVVAESNFIRGGLFEGVDELPELNGEGFLVSGSNLINQGQGEVYVTHDIHGELRVNPDVGADEWVDVDFDHLPDEWENRYFGSVSQNGFDDTDNDGFDAREEYELGGQNMSPLVNDDIDQDGVPAAWDVSDTDTADALIDSDSDGLNLLEEYLAETDPDLADTDDDGLTDKEEIDNGLNPNDWTDALRDFDGDRVPNLWEIKLSGLDIINGLDVLTLAHTDPENTPEAHITVDVNAPTDPNTYTNIADAIDAGNLVDSECVIINVKPGSYVYDNNSYESIEKPLLLLGDTEIVQGDTLNSGYPDLVELTARMRFDESIVALDGFKLRSVNAAEPIIYNN